MVRTQKDRTSSRKMPFKFLKLQHIMCIMFAASLGCCDSHVEHFNALHLHGRENLLCVCKVTCHVGRQKLLCEKYLSDSVCGILRYIMSWSWNLSLAYIAVVTFWELQ